MIKEEILKKANIPESIWDKCYITEEGQIFTPTEDKTGEDIYIKWLEIQNKEDSSSNGDTQAKESSEERVEILENTINELILGGM